MVVTVVEHNYFKEQRTSIITLAQTAKWTDSHFTGANGLAFQAYISPLLARILPAHPSYCIKAPHSPIPRP